MTALRCLFLLGACFTPALHSFFSGIEPVFDKGEAFSGAFLAQTSLLIESPKVRKYMTQLSNPAERMMCETATYMLFQRLGRQEADIERWGGPPGQTIDLFDFSVLHLSSAERLFNKAQRHLVPEQVGNTGAALPLPHRVHPIAHFSQPGRCRSTIS